MKGFTCKPVHGFCRFPGFVLEGNDFIAARVKSRAEHLRNASRSLLCRGYSSNPAIIRDRVSFKTFNDAPFRTVAEQIHFEIRAVESGSVSNGGLRSRYYSGAAPPGAGRYPVANYAPFRLDDRKHPPARFRPGVPKTFHHASTLNNGAVSRFTRFCEASCARSSAETRLTMLQRLTRKLHACAVLRSAIDASARVRACYGVLMLAYFAPVLRNRLARFISRVKDRAN
jgi:hypothetical protein